MGDACHYGEYATETMEKGNWYAKAILFREAHALSNKETIVDYVVVGKHDPFRKTGSSGGILHVNDFMGIKTCLNRSQFFIGHLIGESMQIIEVQHPRRCLLSYEDNLFQTGKLGAFQRARGGLRNLRGHIAKGLGIIGVLESLYQKEGVGIRLLQDVFQFSGTVTGVDGNQDCANPGRSELQNDPLRDIRGPDRDVITLFYPQPEETLGDPATDLIELAIGIAKPPIHVNKRVVIRKTLRHPPQ
jgi:hypothetical protein